MHLFHYGTSKAGMDQGMLVSKEKQVQIIEEATAGSSYYHKQLEKDQETDTKIASMQQTLKRLSASEKNNLSKQVQKIHSDLESKRDLHGIKVVIDMDAFYASVEIRDRPDLADLPVAVGKGVICTCNYVARRYGVRSAMPSFVADKLCPDLIYLDLNFDKYKEASEKMQGVVREYDPSFHCMSMDEVYVDLTSYIHSLKDPKDHDILQLRQFTEDTVREIQKKIFAATNGLTCSCGIANNFMLAKISADVNKPNGIFSVPPSRDEILSFLHDLPTRKVSGIGKVSEKVLQGIGVTTMNDCRTSAHLIHHLFSPKFAMFVHRCALGIGDDEIQHKGAPQEADGSVHRKSLSHTETFKGMNKSKEITEKCQEIARIVSQQMKAEGLHARTLTLRLKDVKYNEITRSKTSKTWMQEESDISKVALELLQKELPLHLRLLGIGMSSFKDAANPQSPGAKSMNIKAAFARVPTNNEVKHEDCVHSPSVICDENSNIYDFNIEAFDGIDESMDSRRETVAEDHARDCPAPGAVTTSASTEARSSDSYQCPVCSDFVSDSMFKLNLHLDVCLLAPQPGISKSNDATNTKKRKERNNTGSMDRFMKKIT